MIGPRIISAYEKLETEKGETDGYIILLLCYARSPFQDFESFPRIVVGLDENDIQIIFKHYNSSFVTYELYPGVYTIKDISEAVYTMVDHDRTRQYEYDDISVKAKPILNHFGGTSGTLKFDRKSFLNTLLGYTPYWVYINTNETYADSPGV